MKETVRFVDTTTRDGQQSNWAMGMPVGMKEAILEDIDQAGYDYICAPLNQIHFKKVVRDLKEDPWEMARMYAKKAPRTPKRVILQPSLFPFDIFNYNREAVMLFHKLLTDMGAMQYVQITANVMGSKDYPWYVPELKKMGLKTAFALCYYSSLRHTTEYFVEKTKMMASYSPDVLYLKDAGGLLDIDSIRTVYKAMADNANPEAQLELHSHCTTGLADAVYVEAMKLGCRAFHVSTPPLAEGTAQPSVFNIAANCKSMGLETKLDLDRMEHASKKLYAMAKADGFPTDFGPTRFNYDLYRHRIPGGVITNMKHHLKELRLENRVDEVIEEVVRVCSETGEPHMITPYSQFVVAQAAINVSMGERYKIVIDEFINFALGLYSEDSGYLDMDQNLKDKFLSFPRAKDLMEKAKLLEREQLVPLSEFRKQFGANLSDEEFLLRYIMNGASEVNVMREATKDGPWKTYSCFDDSSLLDLIDNLSNQPQTTFVQVQTPKASMVLKKAVN